MKVVFDIEADGLDPSLIWVIVCRELLPFGMNGPQRTWTFFPYRSEEEAKRFNLFSRNVTEWVGHYALRYDIPVINKLLGLNINPKSVLDTVIISKLIDFNRPGGHSLEQYGLEFGYPKVQQDRWDQWDDNFVPRCTTDVDITEKVYYKYLRYIQGKSWGNAVRLEHDIDILCQEMTKNGFAFDTLGAKALLDNIQEEVNTLTNNLRKIFPAKTVLSKEVLPRITKFGTLNRSQFKFLGEAPDLSEYSGGAPFSVLEWQEFNPGSTKQRIDRLWEAGWRPTERTEGHKQFLKSAGWGKNKKELDPEKLEYFKRYGWTTKEENLGTLPEDAPKAIQTLIRWILLRSRISRLEEWLQAVGPDNRIHGEFQGIGAWTQRMAHMKPNMGNIPKFNDKRPETTPYSDVMRALWIAGQDHYLVGVDAESIQLRILAHYINDPEFTRSLLSGKKEDASDPHSVNQRALGSPCKSRDDAKTFIYAWLLGAGVGKVQEILQCSRPEAEAAVKNFLDRYQNLAYIKAEVIPKDAAKGYFQGIDGRYIKIFGEDESSKEHFALAGWLQSGEAIAMKTATTLWHPRLVAEKVPFKLVNFVHDEWQLQVPRSMEVAKYVGSVLADALAETGKLFNLNCPLAGSVLSGHGGLAVGVNWLETH